MLLELLSKVRFQTNTRLYNSTIMYQETALTDAHTLCRHTEVDIDTGDSCWDLGIRRADILVN
jgi:hypothetical protein